LWFRKAAKSTSSILQAGYAEKMAAVWEKLAEETSAYSRDSS